MEWRISSADKAAECPIAGLQQQVFWCPPQELFLRKPPVVVVSKVDIRFSPLSVCKLKEEWMSPFWSHILTTWTDIFPQALRSLISLCLPSCYSQLTEWGLSWWCGTPAHGSYCTSQWASVQTIQSAHMFILEISRSDFDYPDLHYAIPNSVRLSTVESANVWMYQERYC